MKKNFKKVIINLSLLPILFSCENSPAPLTGERISIFSQHENKSISKEKITLEKPYINTSWTTDSGNQQNIKGHLAGRKTFSKLFTTDIGHISSKREILYTPVANTKAIFTIDGTLKIRATDINTGKILWEQIDLTNNGLIKFGALTLDNNDLYAITNNSQLLKINAETGEVIYSKYFNKNLKSGLQFCNNKILFTTTDNELYVIDSITGEKLYTHKALEEPNGFIKGSTPACIDDKIVATFSNSEVHMIMADTQTPIWLDSLYNIQSSNINNMSDIIANPIIKDDIVIIKSYNNKTKAFNLTDGTLLWETKNGGKTTPTISNNIMFDINNDNIIFAQDINNSKILWETKLDTNNIVFNPLLVNNQLLIPISNGDIIKVNPYNGNIIGTEDLAYKIDTSPIIIQDKLIILSNGNLKVFN